VDPVLPYYPRARPNLTETCSGNLELDVIICEAVRAMEELDAEATVPDALRCEVSDIRFVGGERHKIHVNRLLTASGQRGRGWFSSFVQPGWRQLFSRCATLDLHCGRGFLFFFLVSE
jgi:hypothetical protein